MVQVSGGALTRTSSVAPSIKDKSQLFGEIGSTQFLSGVLAPLFFLETAGLQRDACASLIKGRIAGPRAIDANDPELTSLAFGNDRRPNDLPLILISLIGAVQSTRIGQDAAQSAKTCRCHG